MKKYTSQAFPTIVAAVNKLVDFVSPTYGPSNNRIILGDKVLDDGYAIANEFELEDEFENAVVKLVKEASAKTNDNVGDGTTTALIVTQGITSEINKTGFSLSNNSHAIVKELEQGLEEVRKHLLKNSVKIKTEAELEKICFNSFNNKEVAKIVSKAVFAVHPDGVVTIEESKGVETTSELVEGMQFDRGFASPYMATDTNGKAIYENTDVLIIDGKISTVQEVAAIIQNLIKAGKGKLTVIADEIDNAVLGTLVLNKLNGNFHALVVKSPGFGDNKKEVLEDIAALTGATVVSAEKGFDLSKIELSHLGKLDKVISSKSSTTLVVNKSENLKARVKLLKEKLKNAESDFEKAQLENRIAKLSGGVAVIRVGATTESELHALKFKVEDALNAAKAALRGGVSQGAGLALNVETSSPILNKALKYPRKKLEANCAELDDTVKDPTEVLISAVENAVSIACLLVSSRGILVDKVEKVDPNETNKKGN